MRNYLKLSDIIDALIALRRRHGDLDSDDPGRPSEVIEPYDGTDPSCAEAGLQVA